ncbi:MAG: hypothetical protein ACFE7R_02620, partial [Candidatus Hodarchaeota archaeon]
GGLNNIDGGDLNQVITEYNDTFEDLATQFPGAGIDLDWDEIKWITSFTYFEPLSLDRSLLSNATSLQRLTDISLVLNLGGIFSAVTFI